MVAVGRRWSINKDNGSEHGGRVRWGWLASAVQGLRGGAG